MTFFKIFFITQNLILLGCALHYFWVIFISEHLKSLHFVVNMQAIFSHVFILLKLCNIIDITQQFKFMNSFTLNTVSLFFFWGIYVPFIMASLKEASRLRRVHDLTYQRTR